MRIAIGQLEKEDLDESFDQFQFFDISRNSNEVLESIGMHFGDDAERLFRTGAVGNVDVNFAAIGVLKLEFLKEIAFSALGGDDEELRLQFNEGDICLDAAVLELGGRVGVNDELAALAGAGINAEEAANGAIAGELRNRFGGIDSPKKNQQEKL